MSLLTEPLQVFEDDPLRPGLIDPTPRDVVAALTREERQQRVQYLVGQAHDIIDQAVRTLAPGQIIAGRAVLWSGGNDSNTLAHIMRPTLDAAVMANTGIGIEATRQFVRDQAAAWSLPLIEKTPPTSYEDMVIAHGFPGPPRHNKMWQQLKERCFRAAIHDFGISGSRKHKVVFLGGRRRAESENRKDAPLYEKRGNIVYASPLIMWTKLDILMYRQMHDDVPRNPTSELLHMSGECLCGAYAKPGELDEIGFWFPDTKAYIEDLQDRVRAAGNAPEKYCKWGHGLREGYTRPGPSMCGNCRDEPTLFDG